MGSLSSPIVTKNNPPDILNPLDPEEFRRQGHMVVDFIADYYMKIEQYSVLSQIKPGYLQKHLPKSAPYTPEPIETILQDVQRHIVPGITHWQSPSFFAYFPASHSIAGFVGEMLTSGFNVAGFNWLSSPAATELESIVTDWLGEMLKLPNDFLFSGNGGGVIQGTTCEAVLCTVIAARDKKLSQVGREKIGKLVVYCSDQTHSSFQKASRIAGIPPENFRAIETKRSAFFAQSPDSLRSAICSDMEAGLIPLFLCATVGTTATSAVDPLRPLADIAKNYGLWLHVDAAYGGNACICPEFQHFLDGIESVDSFSLNMHKWLLTTLSCCCLWLKDPRALAKSLSTDPEYLRNKVSSSKQVVDYKDWQIPLTRRFQAMKLWLVLRSYGVANLQSFLRSHVEMAKHFERLVAADKRFEIVVPRNFSMVCFRLLPYEMNKMPSDGDIGNQETMEEHANELNRKLLESINESGKLFMTHAVVGGVYIIRFAVGATLTKDRHVLMAWKVVQEHANGLLGSA